MPNSEAIMICGESPFMLWPDKINSGFVLTKTSHKTMMRKRFTIAVEKKSTILLDVQNHWIFLSINLTITHKNAFVIQTKSKN
mgnify:CR=1 FL=1